jgi:hypothetical protein
MPRPRILAALLLLVLSLPAAAALTAAPPRQLTAPAVEPAIFNQTDARIAGNGEGFLAVWVNGTSTYDVLAARVRPDGTPEDAPLIPIATNVGRNVMPAVAGGDGVCLVAWHSMAAGVNARLVREDGTTGDLLALSNTYAPRVQVAFSRNVFLVVWEGGGATIDRAGRVLGRFPLPATTALQVVATATGFRLLTVSDPGLLVSIAISPEAVVSAPVTIAPLTDGTGLTILAAARGEEVVIAWSTWSADVRTDRVVVMTPEQTMDVPAQPNLQLLDIVADQAGYLFFYADWQSNVVYSKRLGSSSLTTVPQPSGAMLQDAASNGSGTVAVYNRNRHLLTGSVEAGTASLLVRAPRHQAALGGAVAGALRLAAWSEYDTTLDRATVTAARFTAGGDSLDPHGLVLGIGATGAPHVASNGTDWLVVYNNENSLWARRVTAAGTLPDAEPIRIGENYAYSGFDVGWDGTSYVVTWTGLDGFRSGFSVIQYCRVGAGGSRTEPVWITGQGYSRYPSIASSPAGSLVIWSDSGQLRGALLSPSGTVVPIAFPGVLQAPERAVAFNGTTFLVTWQTAANDLEWAVVSTTGVVRFPPWNRLDVNAAVVPVLSTLGDDFLLAFTDGHVTVALLSGDGYVLQPPAAVAGQVGISFPIGPHLALAGSSLLYAAPIGHPVRETTRIVVSTVEPVPGAPKRRAVR